MHLCDMKIEKVENGFIVEVGVETPEHVTASTVIGFGTEKHICHDLTDLLNFINAHYAEEPKLEPGTIVEIN